MIDWKHRQSYTDATENAEPSQWSDDIFTQASH